jgi:hypothetical protein
MILKMYFKTLWERRLGLFMPGILLLSCILTVQVNIQAQIQAEPYLELGKTNVSDGLFVKAAICGQYAYKTHGFGIGGRMDVLSRTENHSPSVYLNYTETIPLKSFPFEVKGFYMYNRYSGMLYESNYGILLAALRKYWIVELGTNFRTYGMTGKALKEDPLLSDNKIRENFNIMYTLGRYLKPKDHSWNVGLYLTDFDRFSISQETNPVFGIEGFYKPCGSITVFLDTRYISAGALNLSVNPFGYTIKTGIIWQIGQ